MPEPIRDDVDEEADRLLLGADSEAKNLGSENFIDTYAQTNVVRSCNFGSNWVKLQKDGSLEAIIKSNSVRGNSRDDPPPWIYRYQKTPGCSFETVHSNLSKHEFVCNERLVCFT
jgi:hypothetical protein